MFYQRQVDCGQLYQMFEKEMCTEHVDPIGAPISLPQCRLVDCFTKGTEEYVKDSILIQSTLPNSTLRLIICTAAFGMGIECVGVSRVIHWGPPNDVETYIQQTGRSGRSGQLSYCILLFGKGLRRYCDKQILAYCQNTSQCSRNILFHDFSSYTNTAETKCCCCDICASICKCSKCVVTIDNLCLL